MGQHGGLMQAFLKFLTSSFITDLSTTWDRSRKKLKVPVCTLRNACYCIDSSGRKTAPWKSTEENLPHEND
jgi:hypothetical protein